MTLEQKSALMDKTIHDIIEATEAEMHTLEEKVEALNKLANAVDPLTRAYMNDLQEVLNPLNPRLIPCFVFCLKIILSSLEKQMLLPEKALLELIEQTHSCTEIVLPSKR